MVVLSGMADDLLLAQLLEGNVAALARAVSIVENGRFRRMATSKYEAS